MIENKDESFPCLCCLDLQTCSLNVNVDNFNINTAKADKKAQQEKLEKEDQMKMVSHYFVCFYSSVFFSLKCLACIQVDAIDHSL